jgi:MYXO-CTERM domain-containing protein
MKMRQIRLRWRSAMGAAAMVAGALLATPAAAGPYSDAVLAKNPFAYWRMNETSGTTMLDSSGNGRHGVYLGGFATGAAGPLAEAGNTAVRFAAAQFGHASVTIADTFGGTGWGAYTIEAWVNLGTSTNTFQVLMSSPGNEFVRLMTNDSPPLSNVYGALGTAQQTTPSVAQLTGWHHLVLTGGAGGQSLYLDGTLIGQGFQSTGNLVPTSTLLIGGGFLGGFFMNGALDEVAIYRTTLSQAQVNQNFLAASQVPPAATPEPAAMGILALGLAALGGLRRRARLPSD